MHNETKNEIGIQEKEGTPSTLQIGELEYSVGSVGASEVVVGPPCVVAIFTIALFSSR